MMIQIQPKEKESATIQPPNFSPKPTGEYTPVQILEQKLEQFLIEANGTLEINEPLMFPSNEWKQNLFKDFEQVNFQYDSYPY